MNHPACGPCFTSRSNAVFIHRHRLNLLASLAELLEEGTDKLVPHPQDVGSLGIHDPVA